MKLRFTAMLVFCHALAAVGASKAVTFGDKQIVVGERFTPRLMVDITQLRYYAARDRQTGAEHTVVTGVMTSRYPKQDFVIHIDIILLRISGTGVASMGMAQATVEQPAPNRPVRFKALGPRCYFPEANDRDRFCGHMVNVRVEPYVPPQPAPR